MRNSFVQPLQMGSNYRAPSVVYNNSFRNNRVAPPPQFQDSSIYSKKSSPVDNIYSNNPNRSYYRPKNSMDRNILPYDSPEQNDIESPSWFSKGSCFGLTRLTGGILFGIMALIAVGALAGLIVSIVLYVNNTTTDVQWDIFGIVVCSVMLSTILIALFLFIYCYKKGRIITNKDEKNPPTPLDNLGNNFRRPNNYNQSLMPYGMMENGSPNEHTTQVQDKPTNFEKTMSSLQPRDFKREVWAAINEYGGLPNRSLEPPKVVNHYIQVIPNDTNQSIVQQRNLAATVIGRPVTRIEYIDEQRPRRSIAPQPHYEVIEEVYARPQRRKPEEYVEIVELPKPRPQQVGQGLTKPSYGNMTVRQVKTIEEPNVNEYVYSTDHFYK